MVLTASEAHQAVRATARTVNLRNSKTAFTNAPTHGTSYSTVKPDAARVPVIDVTHADRPTCLISCDVVDARSVGVAQGPMPPALLVRVQGNNVGLLAWESGVRCLRCFGPTAAIPPARQPSTLGPPTVHRCGNPRMP